MRCERYHPSVILMRLERNEIFETISAWGLDPASCELQDLADGTQVDVLHRATQSRFSIRNSNDQVADATYNAKLIISGAFFGEHRRVVWTALIEYLESWTRTVRYEDNTPDLWAELQQLPRVIATAQEADAINTPFRPSEQAEISRRLDKVKRLVRQEFELADEQLAAIDRRLDDAKEACGRLGRKDWIMLFYGAVISTAMTDSVPPGVVQTVLATVVHGIAHIFGFGGPPPVIGTWP